MMKQPKPHDDYYLGWIVKIAAATNVKLGEATLAVYLERLRQLSAEQITTAANRTIEEWNKPSMMPPLAFILERCGRYSEIQPSKPLPAMKQLRDSAGISEDQVEDWKAEGKEFQREYAAKLHDDPKWVEMARRFGAKV